VERELKAEVDENMSTAVAHSTSCDGGVGTGCLAATTYVYWIANEFGRQYGMKFQNSFDLLLILNDE